MDESQVFKYEPAGNPSVLDNLRRQVAEGGDPASAAEIDPIGIKIDPKGFRNVSDEWIDIDANMTATDGWTDLDAEPKHDWGNLDARDAGKINEAMGAPKRKGTAFERAKLVAEEAFAQTPVSGRDDGSTQLTQAARLEREAASGANATDPEVKAFYAKKAEEAKALKTKGVQKLTSYIMLRESLRTDISEANPSLAEQLVGGAAGGITHPLNIVNPSPGKTLLATMAKNFAAGFPLGIVQGKEQGEYDFVKNLAKTNPTIADLLQQGVETGTIMAALGGVFHLVGAKPKAKTKLTADADKVTTVDFDPSKSAGPEQVDWFNLNDTVGPEQVDKFDPTNPAEGRVSDYPRILPEYKDTTWTDLDASQTQFADALKPEETSSGATPSKPLSDLAVPVAEGNPKLPYPEIEGEVPNAGKPVDSASYIPREPEARIPYQEPQGAAPNQPFVDVTEPVKGGYPRLPEALPEIATAEGEAGTHGMELEVNDPVAVGGESLKAAQDFERILQERMDDGLTPMDSNLTTKERLYGFFGHKPQVVSALYRARTALEAAGLLDKFVPSHLRTIWDKVVAALPEDVLFKMHDGNQPLSVNAMREFQKRSVKGLSGYNPDGSQYAALRGMQSPDGNLGSVFKSGLSVETFLHEIYHNVTSNAINIASDPVKSKLPENRAAVKFAKDAKHLYEQVLKKMDPVMQDLYRSELHDVKEFITWGSTDLTFKNVLKGFDVAPNLSGWRKWLRMGGELLGIKGKDVNALEAVLDLSNRFDEISISNATMREFWSDKIAGNITKQDTEPPLPKLNLPEVKREYPVQVAKDIVQISNGDELLKYLGKELVGDIGYAIIKNTPILKQAMDFINRNFTTINQTHRIYGHPILSFVATHIPSIRRAAEVRLQSYKAALEDVIKMPRQDQLQMFKKLVDIQDPELLPMRKQAQETGTQREFLVAQGMDPKFVDPAMQVLEVMQGLYKADQMAAGRLGRDLPNAPMYFPRSHAGTWKFNITDTNGDIRYIKGFDSAADAQRFQTEMAEKMKDNPEGLTVSPVTRVDVPGFMDNLGQMLLEDSMPEHLKKQVRELETSIETAKRKFELERAAKRVGGFIGEVLRDENDAGGFGKRENDRLLDMMSNRIDDSYKFEVQSRIMSDIVVPLMTPEILQGRPRLGSMLNHIVLRELGFDTSVTYKIDRWAQQQADDVSKWVNSFMAKRGGYNDSQVSRLSPAAIKSMAQNVTWFTSMWKLGWNLPVFAVNTLTIPMVAADGVRTALREGVNPMTATMAYIKTLGWVFDEPTMKFLAQAKLEGMTEPRAADLYTITERHGAKGHQNQVDKVVNSGRNAIERMTNWITTAYYYNYYSMARPDLKPTSEAFKKLVYDAKDSWTGNYREMATPMAISGMGVTGKLSSNFSKWTYNQTGRLLNDLSDIRNNPTKMQAYLPLAANMSAIVLLAGVYGAPGAVDYENLRRILANFDIYLKPFSAYYDDVQSWSKETIGVNPLPEWLRRGGMTAVSSKIAEALPGGLESGIDLSGSLRHAGVIQPNTVAAQTFFDIFMSGSKLMEKAWKSAVMGQEYMMSDADKKAFGKGLPAILTNVYKDAYLKEKVNGQWITQAPKRSEGDYAQSDAEAKLELFGFRTEKQNKANEYKYYQLWREQTTKVEVAKLVDETLSNISNADLVKKNLNKIYDLGGDVALDNFQKQLTDRPLKKSSTYEQRAVEEFMNSKDPAAKRELAKTIEKFQKLKSHKTSASQ